MSTIELPALRSNDPLGFLAALGVVELCRTELAMDARLSWAGVGGPAVLVAGVANLAELARELGAIASRWQGNGQLVPPGAGFIPAPLSAAERKGLDSDEPLDPMRMLPAAARRRFAAERERELAGDVDGARWLAGFVNQLGSEKDGGRCELTPIYARTGQQTLHQLYRDYRNSVAKRPDLIREALEAWVRVPDSGANLDARAVRDAVVTGDGTPGNAAVPGATWLALMSVPFFPNVAEGSRPQAVGWSPTSRGGRPRRLVWPVWGTPLDRPAIEVLLSHPDVTRAGAPPRDEARTTRLQVLGVEMVCEATRSRLGKTDGPLPGAKVVWPSR